MRIKKNKEKFEKKIVWIFTNGLEFRFLDTLNRFLLS